MKKLYYLILLAALPSAVLAAQGEQAALNAIRAPDIAHHIKILASDKFGGRGPASRGERLTIDYIRKQFKSYGLRPAVNGSFFQTVPLTEISANPHTALKISGRGKTQTFAYKKNMMAWSKRAQAKVSLNQSPLVFVGYGIDAPKYHWNDYKGVDVKGKTVVILVNDPGYAAHNKKLFTGKAMTYYGRWTYKYEEAARQGAAGAIIVHQTAPAGYPWQVVTGSWSGAQFELRAANRHKNRAKVEGWVTKDAAQKLFAQAGLNFEKLAKSAAKRGFKAKPLGLSASMTLHNTIKHVKSHNVIAKLPGRKRPGEAVIYSAHWDHFGTKQGTQGDNIYNGAVDNASGVAGLLELAQSFSMLKSRPARSVLFLATTSEEQGLLGAKYYVKHPVVPLKNTVADINMDILNVYGPTRDITVVGYGNSSLDEDLARAAKTQDRTLRPDPDPEKGYYFRADHFAFAKQGVPALYTKAGIDYVGHGKQWGMKKHHEYTAKHYHKPSDEYNPNWNLKGAADDVRLFFRVGYQLATSDAWPNWSKDSPFRAIRDRMRPAAGDQ